MDGCRADGQALRGPLARVCCSRQLAPLSAGISALFVISSVASRSFHLFLAVAAYRTYPRRWAGHCAGNAQQHSSHSGCTRPPFLPLISFFVSRACLNLLSFLFPQIVAAIAWSQASRRLLMVGLYLARCSPAWCLCGKVPRACSGALLRSSGDIVML